MDLLGRKSRRLLEQVVTRAEQLEDLANGYKTLADLQERVVSDLSARLDSRESLLADLFRENEELKDRLSKPVVAPVSSRPLHMSEEEQEAKFQLDNNMIDKKEYETLLAELDFQNASIDIDPDYEARPGLTY
jgi:phage shock protein A